MMECAGVDSGAKMLVVSDASVWLAARRVSGMRTHDAIKNILCVANLSKRCCKMRFTLLEDFLG
jgi:hypothetical protein